MANLGISFVHTLTGRVVKAFPRPKDTTTLLSSHWATLAVVLVEIEGGLYYGVIDTVKSNDWYIFDTTLGIPSNWTTALEKLSFCECKVDGVTSSTTEAQIAFSQTSEILNGQIVLLGESGQSITLNVISGSVSLIVGTANNIPGAPVITGISYTEGSYNITLTDTTYLIAEATGTSVYVT